MAVTSQGDGTLGICTDDLDHDFPIKPPAIDMTL